MGIFQTLSFLTDNAIDLMNNTFAMCGKLYGYMINISTTTSSRNLNDYISGLTSSFYVIAGLFMLFRLTISAFGYILEPDKMTDSKAGGGKILLNVVLTIFLLIAFFPNGFLFNFLNDVEDVFLYKDRASAVTDNGGGFFSNIFQKVIDPKKKTVKSSSPFDNSIDILYKDYLAVQNVNAANKLTCYYSPNNASASYKIVFNRNSNNEIQSISSFTTPTGSSYSNSLNGIKGKKVSCDQIKVGYDDVNRGAGGNIRTYKVLSVSEANNTTTATLNTSTSKEDSKQNNLNKKDTTGEGSYRHGLSFDDGVFANSIAGSFYSCNLKDAEDARAKVYKKYQNDLKKEKVSEYGSSNSSDQEKCFEFEVAPLYIQKAGDTGKDLISDEKLDAYFFTGIIFAIAIMIYLVILCVEVIIRNLKLILYQIIAPIPLINGIDPNDKMRSKWLKAYFGAYLDLFMKVFAIQLLARLVVAIPKMSSQINSGVMWKIFFLIALLTFAKMVPNLISKILGIDNLSGASKEVGGMIKKGIGIGAGAAVGSALGGVVGGFTAEGKGATLKNALKGAAQGATSGAKGGLGKVAGSVAAATAKENKQRAEGMNWWQRKKSDVMASAGYDPQRKFDNEIQQKVDEKAMLDKFRKNKDNIESKAESSNYISDLNNRFVTGQVSKEDFKGQRKKMIKAAEEAQVVGARTVNGKKLEYGNWWRQVEGADGRVKLQVADENGNYHDYVNEKGMTVQKIGDYKGSFMERITDSNGDTVGWKKMEKHDSLVARDSSGKPIDQYVKYDAGAVGKIIQAEKEMNAELVNNTKLREMLGLDDAGAREIDTFAEFEEKESRAKDLSNERTTDIIRIQNSDEYLRATGMGSSSK